MHDLNFFAVNKSAQSKNKSFLIFVIILLVIVLLINVGLFFGRRIILNGLKDEIQSMNDYIDNPVTRQAIDEADKIRNEAELTTRYLGLLKVVDGKLNQMDQIKSELLMNISELTPVAVSIRSAQINGINILLTCESSTPTGPMDMYHALIQSSRFDQVVMSGITISETGSSFTINFVISPKGGEQP